MFIEKILKTVELQGIYDEANINDIAVNIFLNDGTILPLSFILDEDKEYLNIVATDVNGLEKINIINKDSIIRISLCYADEIIPNNEIKEDLDKMLI